MRGLWIAGAMLIAYGAWASPPKSSGATTESPTKKIQSSDKTDSRKYPTEHTPLPVRVFQSPEDAAHTAAREQKADQDQREYLITQQELASVAIPAVIVACIGAALSLIALILLWRTFRETKRTADAAKDSADAGTRAAVAAEQNVTVIKDTARHQLRAYVFAKGVNSSPHTDGHGGVKEYIVWSDFENIGSTQAMEARVWIRPAVVPIADPIPTFIVDKNILPSVIGPRVTARSAYVPILISDLSRLWRNEVAIYVWIRVEYKDIFDGTFLHHHEQCARLQLIHNPVDVPPPGHVPYVQFVVMGPQNTAS